MNVSSIEGGDAIAISSKLAASAMRAQSARLRIVSENVANAETTANTPGGDPYARKTITFREQLDRASGAEMVRVRDVGIDRTPFQFDYDPGHPAADEKGYVKKPNVNLLIELADMQEATRAYSANVQMIKFSRTLSSMTIDLLRTS
ncbi:flagellar basal body rod protein FlgC [Pseudochelatococcus contaminans]|uniref:Flagellar basal-body rod protein FlgC n=1 Tax=Pseudochelatococcus contaminans TaxID=1538103 RepID=A0A7W6EE35_9HYPH|nr:flagellar basal body rod protein FlgC [Pseudochelatococcus contaminans]MBB3808023.1 flagellar basal-body rod protein FlgC [Pseudochelatococcus contaminans]